MQKMSEIFIPDPTSLEISVKAKGICKGCGKETEPWSFYSPGSNRVLSRPAPDICPVCEEKAEREEKEKQEALERQDRVLNLFKSSGIPPRFVDKNFENFKLKPGNKPAFEAAFNFEPNKAGEGIYFCGPSGVGKTHLISAIASKLMPRYGLLYISSVELIHELKKGISEGQSHQKLEAAKKIQVLLLDDVGVEKPSPWVDEIFWSLINYRYENVLTTIMTSNFNLTELKERLDPRVVSRIIGMCRYYKIQDEDQRKFEIERGPLLQVVH